MGLMARAGSWLRQVDEHCFSVDPAPELPAVANEELERCPLIVADVGAADGTDPRWSWLGRRSRFVLVEPRVNSVQPDPNRLVLPVALGARRERRTLHLTRFGQSSSLFSLDPLRVYATASAYEKVGESSLQLTTLDEELATRPEWYPKFLKIDVEGAELEVLQGADSSVRSAVLGLEIEVALNPRHVGAPLMSEVDQHLRARGYALFRMSPLGLVRANEVFGAASHAQPVWADAVYFLTAEVWSERLKGQPPGHRGALLAQFMAILLSYRSHDYAMEILERSAETCALTNDQLVEWREAIRRAANEPGALWLRLAAGALVACLVGLAGLVVPAAKAEATAYFKRRLGLLFRALSRRLARGGYNQAIIQEVEP